MTAADASPPVMVTVGGAGSILPGIGEDAMVGRSVPIQACAREMTGDGSDHRSIVSKIKVRRTMQLNIVSLRRAS